MLGDNSVISTYSYFGFGRETTWGTGITASTAELRVISSSIKTTKDNKVLEQIERDRVYSQRIGLGKVVSGSMEFYADPDAPAVNYIMHNAFGGSITTATVSAGASFTHTYDIGNIVTQTYTSLTLNNRKGDATLGKVFEYTGGRVGQLQVMSEIDEALKMNAEFVFKDSTITSNDVQSSLTGGQANPLSFVGGRFSAETTFAALTSASYWHVQSFELTIANNLKSDSESRRIGSDTLDVLPTGIANLQVTAQIRWDTTTAYDAMLNGTQLALELMFEGDTITGSSTKRSIKFQMPKVYVKEAGDPEVGGPDEVLVSEVVFDILKDTSTTTGYALKAIVTNGVSSYA
jgi:hypothetical protein